MFRSCCCRTTRFQCSWCCWMYPYTDIYPSPLLIGVGGSCVTRAADLSGDVWMEENEGFCGFEWSSGTYRLQWTMDGDGRAACQQDSCLLADCWSWHGREKAQIVPWGLGPRDWGSLSGRLVTCFLFQLGQVVLTFLGAAGLSGDAWPGEVEGFSGLRWQSGYYRSQCPMGGNSGWAAAWFCFQTHLQRIFLQSLLSKIFTS